MEGGFAEKVRSISPRWLRNISPSRRQAGSQPLSSPCQTDRKQKNKISARGPPGVPSALPLVNPLAPAASGSAGVPFSPGPPLSPGTPEVTQHLLQSELGGRQRQPQQQQPPTAPPMSSRWQPPRADDSSIRPPAAPPASVRAGSEAQSRLTPGGEALRRSLQDIMDKQLRSGMLRQMFQELLDGQTALIVEAIRSQGAGEACDVYVADSPDGDLQEDKAEDLIDIKEPKNQNLVIPSASSAQPPEPAPSVFGRAASLTGESTNASIPQLLSFRTKPLGAATPKANNSVSTQLWIEKLNRYDEGKQDSLSGQMAQATAAALEWWDNFQEPPSDSWVDRLIRSQLFTTAIGITICVHMILTAYETDWMIENYSLPLSPGWFRVELVFNVLYLLEIAVRMFASGRYFFYGKMFKWNFFDLFIVAVSTFNLFSLENPRSLSWMRTLRILRVVMIARFLRVLRFFGLGSLQLMINCIIGTLGTIAWCLMLVAFLTFSFSIFFVQSFAFSLEADQEDMTEEQFKEVMNRFGSVSKGMLTLSMAISGGMDWGDIWDILRLAGPLAHSFYLGFVFFSLIAMWNIITSIFVEKALQFAKPDADARTLQVRKSQMESAKELKQLFAHIHFNDAHACTFQDFSDFLAVPEFWAGLEEKGINPEEAETFFLMLLKQNPTNDDRVDIDFLVESCLRIKGPASSMDLQMMRYELREMKRNQAAIVKLLHSAAHRRPQARQRTKPPGALRAADEPKTVQHTSAGSSYLGN